MGSDTNALKKAVCATLHVFHTWNGRIRALVASAADATLPYLNVVRNASYTY